MPQSLSQSQLFSDKFSPAHCLRSFGSLHHRHTGHVLATRMTCPSNMLCKFAPLNIDYTLSLSLKFPFQSGKLLSSFSSDDIAHWFDLTIIHIYTGTCSLKRTFISIIYWKATKAYRICWQGINIWISQMKRQKSKEGRDTALANGGAETLNSVLPTSHPLPNLMPLPSNSKSGLPTSETQLLILLSKL